MSPDTRSTLAVAGATLSTIALTILSAFWFEFALPDWLLLQAIAAAVLIFGVGLAWLFLYRWIEFLLGGDKPSFRRFFD